MSVPKDVLVRLSDIPGLDVQGKRLAFLGKPFTRRATETVVNAVQDGVKVNDVFDHISTAAIISEQQGRTKIGPFGVTKGVFSTLDKLPVITPEGNIIPRNGGNRYGTPTEIVNFKK